MRCPRCGTDNDAAAKFCEECGAARARACAKRAKAIDSTLELAAEHGFAFPPALAQILRAFPAVATSLHAFAPS